MQHRQTRSQGVQRGTQGGYSHRAPPASAFPVTRDQRHGAGQEGGMSPERISQLYSSMTAAADLRSAKAREATIRAAAQHQPIIPLARQQGPAGSAVYAATALGTTPRARWRAAASDFEFDARSDDSAEEKDHDVRGTYARACTYGRRTIFADGVSPSRSRRRGFHSPTRVDEEAVELRRQLSEARRRKPQASSPRIARMQPRSRDLSRPMKSLSLKGLRSAMQGGSRSARRGATSESARVPDELWDEGDPMASPRAYAPPRSARTTRGGGAVLDTSLLASSTGPAGLVNLTPGMLRRVGIVQDRGLPGVPDAIAARLAVAQYIYSHGPKPVPMPKVPVYDPPQTRKRRLSVGREANRAISRRRPRYNQGQQDPTELYELWHRYAQQHGIDGDGSPGTIGVGGITGYPDLHPRGGGPTGGAGAGGADGFGELGAAGFGTAYPPTQYPLGYTPVSVARASKEAASAPPTPQARGKVPPPPAQEPVKLLPRAKGTLTVRLNNVQGLAELMGDSTAAADVYVCGKRVGSELLRIGADPDQDADGAVDPTSMNAVLLVPLNAGDVQADDAIEVMLRALPTGQPGLDSDGEPEEETLGVLRIPLADVILQGRDQAVSRREQAKAEAAAATAQAQAARDSAAAAKAEQLAKQAAGVPTAGAGSTPGASSKPPQRAAHPQEGAAEGAAAPAPQRRGGRKPKPEAPPAPIPRTLFAQVTETLGDKRSQSTTAKRGVVINQVQEGALADAQAFDVTPVLATRHSVQGVFRSAEEAEAGEGGGVAGRVGQMSVRLDYAPVLDGAAVRLLGRMLKDLNSAAEGMASVDASDESRKSMTEQEEQKLKAVLTAMLQKMDSHGSAGGGEAGTAGVVLSVLGDDKSGSTGGTPAFVEVRTRGEDGRVVVRGAGGGKYSGHWAGAQNAQLAAAGGGDGAAGRVVVHLPLSEVLGEEGRGGMDVLVRDENGVKVGHTGLHDMGDVALQGLAAALLEHQSPEGGGSAGALPLTDDAASALRRFLGQRKSLQGPTEAPATVRVKDSEDKPPASTSGTPQWGRMHETQVGAGVTSPRRNTGAVTPSGDGKKSVVTAEGIESGVCQPLLRAQVGYTALTEATAKALQSGEGGAGEDEVVGTLHLRLDKDSLHALAPSATAVGVRIAGEVVAVELPPQQWDEEGRPLRGGLTELDIQLTAGVLHDLGISTDQVAVTTTAAEPVVVDLLDAHGAVAARTELGTAVPTVARGTAAALGACGVAPNHYTSRLGALVPDTTQVEYDRTAVPVPHVANNRPGSPGYRPPPPSKDGEDDLCKPRLQAKVKETVGGRMLQSTTAKRGVVINQVQEGALADAQAFDVTPVLATRHSVQGVFRSAEEAEAGEGGGVAGRVGQMSVRLDYAPVLDGAAVRLLGRMLKDLDKAGAQSARSRPAAVKAALTAILLEMDEHDEAGGEAGTAGVVLSVLGDDKSGSTGGTPAFVEVRTRGEDGRVVVRGAGGGKYSGHWAGAQGDGDAAGRVVVHLPLSEVLGEEGRGGMDVLVRDENGVKVGHTGLHDMGDVALQGLAAALLEHQSPEGGGSAGALPLTDDAASALREFLGQASEEGSSPAADAAKVEAKDSEDKPPASTSGTPQWGRMHETQVGAGVTSPRRNTGAVTPSGDGKKSVVTAEGIESGVCQPLLRAQVGYTALTEATAKALQSGEGGVGEDEVVGTLHLRLDKDSLHALAPSATAVGVRIAGEVVAVELPPQQWDEEGRPLRGGLTELDIQLTAGVLHDLGISTDQVAVTTTAAEPVVVDLLDAHGAVAARTELGTAVPTVARGTAAALGACGVAPNHYTSQLASIAPDTSSVTPDAATRHLASRIPQAHQPAGALAVAREEEDTDDSGPVTPIPPRQLEDGDVLVALPDQAYDMADPESHVLDAGLNLNMGLTWQPDVADLTEVLDEEDAMNAAIRGEAPPSTREQGPSKSKGAGAGRRHDSPPGSPGDPSGMDALSSTARGMSGAPSWSEGSKGSMGNEPTKGDPRSRRELAQPSKFAHAPHRDQAPPPATFQEFLESSRRDRAADHGRASHRQGRLDPLRPRSTAPLGRTLGSDGYSMVDFHEGKRGRPRQSPRREDLDEEERHDPRNVQHDIRSMDDWFERQEVAAMPTQAEMHDATTSMQKLWRGHQGRKEAAQVRRERDAAVRIQSLARGRQARTQYTQMQAEQAAKEAAAAEQLTRVAKGHLARRKAQHIREDRAATNIQRVFRGHVAAEQVECRRVERKAAVAIQSAFRGMQGRQTAQHRQAEVACESAWKDVQRVLVKHAEGTESGEGLSLRKEEKVKITPYHTDVSSDAVGMLPPGHLPAVGAMDPLAPPTVVALAASAVLLGVENPTWDMVKAMLQSGDLQHKLTTTLPYQIPDERRQRALAVLRLLPDHDKACHATGSFPDDFAHFARLAPKDVHDSRDTSHAPRMHKGYVPSTASYASPKVSPGRSEGGAEGFHAGQGKEDSVGEDDALAVLVGLETAQDESEVQAESAHALRAWALNLALWDASTSVENRAAAAIQAAARARAARREAAKSRNPSGIEVVAVSEMGESDSDTGSVSSFRDLKVSQEAIDAISGQVLNITAEQMTELVQTPKPTQDMVVVAGSLCVLLNVPKPSWSTAKKVIRKRGFLKKLSMVHPSLLEEKSRRVSRRVLRKHPAHAKAIVDVQGLVKQATMGRTLSHGASMADLYGGMKEVKARRLRTAASMAIMSRRAAARARGGLSPIPDEAAMSGSASTSQLGRPSTQGNLTRPYASQAGDGEAGVQFLGSGGSALSGSGSAVDIAKAFKGSANRAATAEDLEKAGVDVGALQILHRWCLLMSWWNPKEKASLAKGLGAKVDQEVVEHYRELGYENPEEAAAAAAIAAAAEVSEGDHVSDVFKKQGQFVSPEHLDHYTRHFKRMELERKATASNMRSTPTLKSAGEAIRAGLRMKAGSAAGSNPEDDDSEEEAQAARAHTPDEPVLTLKEARQALASLSAEEVAGLQKVDPGSPAMAVVASAICILTRSQPSWQSARALFAQPLELLSGLVNIKQGAVSERMRHVLATLMGSRRLHGLSRSRERSSGRVLSTFLRWLIALLSDSKMALSDVPLPRSARMSAVQFSYVGLEERKLARIRSRAKMAAGDASSVGERSVDSGHDRSVPTYPSNSTAKVIRFVEHFDPTKEGVCAMTARAVFRSLAWRAKMRLRQWTQAKAMDDLKLSTTLGRSRRGLLDLTRHDINTFRRQRPVTQESVIIAGGICVLLGVKPSWKYTRKVLEEPDILQFFVKLAREQIDEDSRSVVRGLLEEHGEELPRLVRASPFMLVHRFHAWFLAFTEGVEVARDAASRAASRPDSSAGTPRPGSRPASGAAAGEVAFNK